MKDDNIEFLDLAEEVVYTKKEVVVEQSVAIEGKPLNKKEKKRLRTGEKVFLAVSILFIIGCFIFYGYRTYHYYHATHDVVKNITLGDKLTTLNNIAFKDDGLYEKTGYFYYKGSDVNNYAYYSGRLFRIIDIGDTIRLIEDETETNLVWTYESDYNDSHIHTWLNNYLNTLKDYDLYLEKTTWCNDAVDLENYSCTNTIEDYVGLLSTSDYLQAGGKNSYLNNETYFWTINQDYDRNVFYVNNEGNINNISKKEENYFSYGVRPVISLKSDVGIVGGDGTADDPYIIEYLGNALLRDNSVGNYVRYNGDDYRILNIDETGISLIYDGVLEIEKKYTDINKYLNSEFIKKFNKTELVKNDYYVDEYSYNNKYDTTDTNKKTDYITIPSIGDLFLNEYNGYWLNDYSDNKLGLYYTLDENTMFFSDLSSNKHTIRPIIKLNSETVVTSGTGLKVDPLIVGEEGEDNVEED